MGPHPQSSPPAGQAGPGGRAGQAGRPGRDFSRLCATRAYSAVLAFWDYFTQTSPVCLSRDGLPSATSRPRCPAPPRSPGFAKQGARGGARSATRSVRRDGGRLPQGARKRKPPSPRASPGDGPEDMTTCSSSRWTYRPASLAPRSRVGPTCIIPVAAAPAPIGGQQGFRVTPGCRGDLQC